MIFMPANEEKRRGVLRYRTIDLPNGKYIHIAIVKKPGVRGGRTIAGKVHTLIKNIPKYQDRLEKFQDKVDKFQREHEYFNPKRMRA